MDDLILGTSDADPAELDDTIEIESTSAAERIQCAYFAIASVEGMDTAMMGKAEAKRIKTIISRSIDLIEDAICEMHTELFEPDEPEL